jgi:hypothetical protein
VGIRIEWLVREGEVEMGGGGARTHTWVTLVWGLFSAGVRGTNEDLIAR